MAAAKQRAKYRPRATSEDLCKCTRTGAAKDFGEVTHLMPYYDAHGTRLYSRFRYLITVDNHSAGPKGDKTFRYCHHYDRTNPEHVALIYGLPRVHEAKRLGIPHMYLCEGEPDCEACWALADAYATTTHLGTRFPKEVAEHFRGYLGTVYIMVDRDHLDPEHQARFNHEDPAKQRDYPGAASALRRWRALREVGVKVFFREAIRGKDLRDHLEAGKTLAQLKKVTLDEVRARAPREAGLKKLDGLRLATVDMPEGPAMVRFVQALEKAGHQLEPIGPSRYKTNCPNPNHPDRNPSFEFEQGETDKGVGCVRMWCESSQGPCTDRDDPNGMQAICDHLGITTAELFDDYNKTGKISVKQKQKEAAAQAIDSESYPAFHDAFEGLIGSTSDNEPNDKGNGKRMLELYGRVFRHVSGGKASRWYAWTGTHWAPDTNALVSRATADLTDYMTYVELPQYVGEDVPSFPDDWTVANSSGTTFQALLGKNGALAKAPGGVAAWLGGAPGRTAWFGARLKAEQEQELFIETEKWIEKCKEGARMREAAKQLEHQPGISVTMDEFDQSRGSFAVQNGQINTRTGEFEPHDIDEMNTRIAPVTYDPRARAPLWESFLAKNQPNPETRKYLQKLAGYALSGDGNQKLIAFMYSAVGDTGKSVFTNTLEAVMGEEYAMTLADGVLSKRRFDTGGRDPDRDAIRGRRLALSMELAPNEPMDERFVKQLTGGDGVSTRGNYAEGNKRWQPECLVMVATNHLSRINAEDQAIWNRIQVVPWKVAFPPGHPDRDDQLSQKIRGVEGFAGELDGVFNWMVEGLRLYRAEGLIQPEEVVEASSSYRVDADIVQKWVMHASSEGDIEIGEHTPEGEHYVSQVTPLYKIFEVWSKTERARDIPGLQAFGKRLEEMGYTKVAKYRRDPYKGRAVILGIRIPADAEIKFNVK
jgi:P4 family phage/plasmid primase-like protien